MSNPDPHFEYVLRLADNALILGQRLCEWCGHSPFIEEDVAMANTALDHIGRARFLLSHAGELEGQGRDEDALAYFRVENEFRNFLICELPIGDFAFTIVRQYLLDAYHYFVYQALQQSTDPTLAAIAAKAIKECEYHVRRSSQWLIRLGDGTEESHAKVQSALDDIWRFTTELHRVDDVDVAAEKSGVGVKCALIESTWRDHVKQTMQEATLSCPTDAPLAADGRKGIHKEHMGYLLAEMQSVQRTYPGLQW